MTPPNPHDDEVQFHLEMLVRRYVEEGLDATAARERALARMGDLRAAAAARQAIDRRGASGARRRDWFRGWGQDARHAWRILRRSPGFVALAVLMLGLGTGASAAVFSVVDAVLLRSAFDDPDSSVFVRVRRPDGLLTSALPRELYERLAAQLPPPLATIGIFTIASPIATRVDAPRRTQTECLSPSVAVILGTRPLMGRWFTDADAQPGAAAVAVVSLEFWRGALGGDPNVIGRVIALDDEPVTIVGVMPAGFDGPVSRINRDIWVPYGLSVPQAARLGCRPPDATVNAAARLQPGVSVSAANAALSAAGGAGLVLHSIREETVGDLGPPFNALAGAVVAVLLIAFANVTNLGLERLAARRRDIAVRLALGATSARIVRETVAEHVVVALAGAVAGIGIAWLGFDAMIGLLPESLPNLDVVSLNTRVLLAGIGLTLVGGVGAGCLSAWQISTATAGSNLAAGDRGHTARASVVRRVLVTTELALGVLLLVGALLMVRTFLTLRPTEPGFDADRKHIALVRLPADVMPPARLAFFDAMIRRLSSAPGIRAVAATTSVPWRRSVNLVPATVGDARANVYLGAVTPNYFDLMRIPLRRGRGFTAADRDGAPLVTVVNETFAAERFKGAEPLGQMVSVGRGSEVVTLQIVGVVADTRSFGQDTRTRPFVYRPLAQSATGNAFFMIEAEESAAPALPATVRNALNVVRPDLLVDEVERLTDEMGAEVAQPRLGAWLFGSFAGLAVLLAAVGLAATLAWSVTARRREIGIRMALGATTGRVRRLVIGQTLAMSAIGITFGLLGAAWGTQLLAGWLYGVSPLDATTFAACGTFMLVVALLAAWLPTRRASRVDPVIALREDA